MKRLSLILIIILLAVSTSFAGDFPNKPITLIVPAKAGGGFDITSRVAAAGWEKILGHPMKFVYLPGASTMIGFSRLMASPSDGYTIIVTSILMHAMAVADNEANAKLCGWDKVAFVGNVIADPDVLLVNNESSWNTLDDFINAGKNAKDPLIISTPYAKSVGQLASQILISETGINAKGVPFNSGTKSRDVLAGKQVSACIGAYYSSSSKKAFIKGIGSFTAKKTYPGIWDMPTMTQGTGIKMPTLIDSYCFMIKRDTINESPEAYKKLVETLKQALETKESQTMAKSLEMEHFVEYWSPEECEDYVGTFRNEVWPKYKHLMGD